MAVHCSVSRKAVLMRKLCPRTFKKRITRWFLVWIPPPSVWLATGVIQAGEKAARFRIDAPHAGGVKGFHFPAVRLY